MIAVLSAAVFSVEAGASDIYSSKTYSGEVMIGEALASLAAEGDVYAAELLNKGEFGDKSLINKAVPANINVNAPSLFGPPPVVQTAPEKPDTKSLAIDKPAVVDLIVFAGQSNMEGPGGNKDLAPKVASGHGYEFRNGKDPKGLYNVVEPFGHRETGWLGERGPGGTLVSSFMNQYYNKTGVPVVGVYAARGGTSVGTFWNNAGVKAELLRRYNDSVNWCTANKIVVRHRYCVWLQGENDCMTEKEAYKKCLTEVFKPLEKNGLEQVFIVTPGTFKDNTLSMDGVVHAQESLCAENPSFTLASEALRGLSDEYFADVVHYNQSALNIAGSTAADIVAAYSLLH